MEILLLAALLLLLFGAHRIPMIARGLGQGIRLFKKELKEDEPDRLDDGSDDSRR
jgi:sec-independent protein translocase protein TatA